MTREEHLAWCKRRALEYVERGELQQAFTSMASDLSKHEGTKDHVGIAAGLPLLMIGHLDSAAQMREFIEGFR